MKTKLVSESPTSVYTVYITLHAETSEQSSQTQKPSCTVYTVHQIPQPDIQYHSSSSISYDVWRAKCGAEWSEYDLILVAGIQFLVR